MSANNVITDNEKESVLLTKERRLYVTIEWLRKFDRQLKTIYSVVFWLNMNNKNLIRIITRDILTKPISAPWFAEQMVMTRSSSRIFAEFTKPCIIWEFKSEAYRKTLVVCCLLILRSSCGYVHLFFTGTLTIFSIFTETVKLKKTRSGLRS